MSLPDVEFVPTRVIDTCVGMRLTVDGKANLADFGFKTKQRIPDPDWVTRLMKSEDDIKTFACAYVWNNWFHVTLPVEEAKRTFLDWKDRIARPSRTLHEVGIDDVAVLRQLIKESSVGATVLNDVLGKRMHFVSYAYLSRVVGFERTWHSLNWRLVKKKFDILESALPLPHKLVSDFSVAFKKQLTS